MYQSKHGHYVRIQKGKPYWDRYEAYHPCVDPRWEYPCIHNYPIEWYEDLGKHYQDVYDWVEEYKSSLRFVDTGYDPNAVV